VSAAAPPPLFGDVADASRETRGWFIGHFTPGERNPPRSDAVEMKRYTHAKGETRWC
jgi:hypothetical protein